jgi:hypothetical protein
MAVIDLFEAMRRKRNFICGRGATDAEVRKIETTLGVQLPSDYVVFLKTFGYALWFGEAIYGVSEGPDCDVLDATLTARKEKLPDFFHPFPNEVIVLSADDEGGYFVLYGMDCGGGVGWLHSDELNAEVEHWETFEEYLRERVEIEAEDDDDESNSLAF